MNETLDSREAAELLHLSVSETLILARKGAFPAVSYGNKWVFLRADLMEYLSKRARAEQRERIMMMERLTQQEQPKRRRGRPRNEPIDFSEFPSLPGFATLVAKK